MSQTSVLCTALVITWTVTGLSQPCTPNNAVPIAKWGVDVRNALDVIKLNSPVVLKNSPAAYWPALRKWDLSFLQSRSTMSMVIGYHRFGNGSDTSHEDAVICPHFKGKNYTEYSVLLPAASCNGEKIMTTYIDITKFNISEHVLIKNSLDRFHPSIYADIPLWNAFVAPLDGGSPAAHDSDLWTTTAGTTSAPHYDLQHNFYAVIKGKKRFTIAPPEDISRLHLFPFHHPRQRQAQSWDYSRDISDPAERIIAEGLVSDEPMPSTEAFSKRSFVGSFLSVELSSGDVLYIPPMWIHSGSSVGWSVSLGTCSPSDVELYIDILEHMRLPFKLHWSFRKRMHALLLFIDVITKEFFSGKTGSSFLEDLYESRYKSTFPDIIVDTLIAGNFYPPEGGWKNRTAADLGCIFVEQAGRHHEDALPRWLRVWGRRDR